MLGDDKRSGRYKALAYNRIFFDICKHIHLVAMLLIELKYKNNF